MRKVVAFEAVSLDGYFTDVNGDMSWAHKQDPEWNAFVGGNASGGGALLFGRVTYELMASRALVPSRRRVETSRRRVGQGRRKSSRPSLVYCGDDATAASDPGSAGQP